jgi:ribosome-associated toxin RatA of RatAB toxin-antitoxin module
MRTVTLTAHVPDTDLATAFARVGDFARYPALVPDVVRSVTVEPSAPGEPVVSAWEVFFRNGLLCWTEADHLHPETATIDFAQTVGDFEEFTGGWQLSTVLVDGTPYVRVLFTADFDFGVPSLASIIDPVAERVLVETITAILRGLFVTVHVDVDVDGDAVPALAGI